MANVTSEVHHKANGSTAEFRSKALRAEAQIEKASLSAASKIRKAASDLAQSSTKYMNSGRDYVQDNPVKSVAVATAAGLVAGGLLTLILRKGKSSVQEKA